MRNITKLIMSSKRSRKKHSNLICFKFNKSAPCKTKLRSFSRTRTQTVGPYIEQKSTIHQVTTMLVISKNVFSGHNHLLTTGTNDMTL